MTEQMELAESLLEHLTDTYTRLAYEVHEGQWKITDTSFTLFFEITPEVISIKGMQTFPAEQGHGKTLLSCIHTFADEYNMQVVAKNVLLESYSFWEYIGYREMEDGLSFIRR